MIASDKARICDVRRRKYHAVGVIRNICESIRQKRRHLNSQTCISYRGDKMGRLFSNSVAACNGQILVNNFSAEDPRKDTGMACRQYPVWKSSVRNTAQNYVSVYDRSQRRLCVFRLCAR